MENSPFKKSFPEWLDIFWGTCYTSTHLKMELISFGF